MKKESSPALSDQEIARTWKRKRLAIYPSVAAGLILMAAGAAFGVIARGLNTSCRCCPRCGHINAPAQGILHGFTCTHCGYTISGK